MKKLVELEGITIFGRKLYVEVDDTAGSYKSQVAVVAFAINEAFKFFYGEYPATVPPEPSHFSREVDSKKDLPDENR